MEQYLAVDDVRGLLKLSRSAVYQLFARQDFPSTRIGRKLFVSETKLQAYLEDGGTGEKRIQQD